MRRSIIVTCLILLGALFVAFHFSRSDRKELATPPKMVSALSNVTAGPHHRAPKSSHLSGPLEGAGEEEFEGESLTVSPEKVWIYLSEAGTNAGTLIAGFLVSSNAEFLRMAATNFANNPMIQLAVLRHNLFPEERQEWLKRFAESAPDNPLPSYLSALDEFRDQHPEKALAALEAAAAKSQFKDYAIDKLQNLDELFAGIGQGTMQAKISAMAAIATENLPFLSDLKDLSNKIGEQKKTGGDPERFAMMKYELADHLVTGGGGHFLINQMVGQAIEIKALQDLSPSQEYAFLGSTPAARIQELKNERTAQRELLLNTMGILTLGDQGVTAYFERLKLYGEKSALEWAKARLGK